MNLKSILFLLILTLFVNCSKDETPTPKPDAEEQPNPNPEEPKEPETEVYFTLNTFVLPQGVEESEDWIILHNANGKLLDYRAYVAGDKLEFEAPTDSLTPTISVTYLKYRAPNDRKYYSLSTTTHVEKGSVENFGPYTSVQNISPTKTGVFDITISKIPNPFGVGSPVKTELSSSRGRLGGSASGTGYSNGIELTFNQVDKYEDFDDYLISILDGNNNLKYYYLNNPDGQDVSTDYTVDFFEVDKDISISLPPHNSYLLNIAGFKDNQEFSQSGGYWLHDVISVLHTDVVTDPLRMGYLDLFTKYRTQFYIGMDGYNYSIVKYGDALDALVIPEKPTLTVIDPSVHTFQFSVDTDFVSAVHNWIYEEGSPSTNDYSRTNWSLIAPKGHNPVLGNIPEEILEKYPSMNLEAIKYISSVLYLSMESLEFLSSHWIKVFKP